MRNHNSSGNDNGAGSAKWLRFLKWFCPPSLYEGIEGDLLEQFDNDVREIGEKRAGKKLVWNVIRFFRPGIIFRNKIAINGIQSAMIRNYYKIGWRNIVRNKAYSLINISGLTLGLSLAIVIFWIVRFEYSFDDFHTNIDRLYQIRSYDRFGNQANSHVPQGVIHALQRQFPAIEKAATVYRQNQPVIKVSGENLKQENTYFMHPEFFEMIDVKWVKGSVQQSLSSLYQVVLDVPTAEKLFHGEDPIGKIIRYDNAMDLTVSGVIEKMPPNSKFQMQMLLSYQTLLKYQQWYQEENFWGGGDSMFQGYVLVDENADISSIEKELAALAAIQKANADYVRFELFPLADSHFDLDTDPFGYVIPGWMLRVLMCIAGFLIVIACINFINLAIAQVFTRNREIGVRKVMGSGRGSIVLQFLLETGIMVSLAVLIACILATELVRFVNEFFSTQVNQVSVWDAQMMLYIFVLIIVVTALAGLYPSLFLSRLKPLSIFNNQLISSPDKGISVRRVLVTSQFIIAQVMVICMIVGTQQINFFYHTDPGFEKEAVVTVNMQYEDSVALKERFQQELTKRPEIKGVTFSLTGPSGSRNWWWGSVKVSGAPKEEFFRLQWVDKNYFEFYHIPLVAGRTFAPMDTSVALINEEALRYAGFEDPEEVLGREFTYWNSDNKVTVIGVVKNYYSQGFKSVIVPHLFLNANWNFQMAQIKIDPLKPREALQHIEKSWKRLHPDGYFEYEFLEDDLKRFYEGDRKLSNFISLFAVVGIVIGCLGLYGLVSFVCARRTKEVSIRKVLGATLFNIVTLLSREFLVLVLMAFMIAIPVGWYVMNLFLQEYAYQIAIHWSVFALAGLLTLVIVLFTAGFKSFNAALMNPAEGLHCD